MAWRWVPTSLKSRLLIGAVFAVVFAIGVAGLINAGLVYRFVRGQIDGRLDSKITSIASTLAVSPNGDLTIEGVLSEPPFDRPGSGWYWQAESRAGRVASASLASSAIVVPEDAPHPKHVVGDRPWPTDITGPFRDDLIARVSDRTIGGVQIRIVATAPDDALTGPLRNILMPLVVSMLALAALLLAALVFGVRLGLKPLTQLSRAVAEIHNGQTARLIESGQPAEVAPLVTEINTLIQRNEAGLERARRHVANLAHGLKTPLTTLSVTLSEPGRDPENAMGPLVTTMERLIRHHLARARTAVLAGPSRHTVDLVPTIVDLASAMEKVHRERSVEFQLKAPEQAIVVSDAQDCNELFGNILDNAFRHATSTVHVTVEEDGDVVRVNVDDDGPGIAEGGLKAALGAGMRLDESTAGYGFGLPIALEIAELQGGSLVLRRSALGGLCVSVSLRRGLKPTA